MSEPTHFHLYLRRTGANYTGWCCETYNGVAVQLRRAGSQVPIPATPPDNQWMSPDNQWSSPGDGFPDVVIQAVVGVAVDCPGD